jgi:hypothetical protein
VQGDFFEEGQQLWVHGPDGATRPAVYVGSAEAATFLGGPPSVYVVFEDTREGAQIALDRVTPRD